MCSNTVSRESTLPPTFLADEEDAVWYIELGWGTEGVGQHRLGSC